MTRFLAVHHLQNQKIPTGGSGPRPPRASQTSLPAALTSPHRATLASLLLVHARLRDTARQLVAAGDPAAQRFEWALRPRYYLGRGPLSPAPELWPGT